MWYVGTCSCKCYTNYLPLTNLIPPAFSYLYPPWIFLQFLGFKPYVKIFSFSLPLFDNSSKWLIIVFSLKFYMYLWWCTDFWIHKLVVMNWTISLTSLGNTRPIFLYVMFIKAVSVALVSCICDTCRVLQ